MWHCQLVNISPPLRSIQADSYSLNFEPIPILIHRLTDKFFAHCLSKPNPLIQQIVYYTLADLTNLSNKYKHKRKKHTLL